MWPDFLFYFFISTCCYGLVIYLINHTMQLRKYQQQYRASNKQLQLRHIDSLLKQGGHSGIFPN